MPCCMCGGQVQLLEVGFLLPCGSQVTGLGSKCIYLTTETSSWSPAFSFSCSPGPHPMEWWHPLLGYFKFSLIKKIPQVCPEPCPSGDSKFCQVGNQCQLPRVWGLRRTAPPGGSRSPEVGCQLRSDCIKQAQRLWTHGGRSEPQD